MGTYILRRLLLMIPTLVGITALVFLLIALSPGGIGAALKVAGGQMEATSRALQEAYLDDRYGLNDPAPVQYVRWLGRVSPIKFGQRDQVAASGEVIQAPKPVREPLLRSWWARERTMPTAQPASFSFPPPPVRTGDKLVDEQAEQAHREERARAYRRAANEYARARAAYVGSGVYLEQAISDYVKAVGRPDAINFRGKLNARIVASLTPETSRPEWANIQAKGEDVLKAYQVALNEREKLAAVFAAKPFDEAGIPIIPGVLSLAKPDMGMSFSKSRPVTSLIGEALPVTLLINAIAIPIIYTIGISTGILAATRKGTWIDALSGATLVALWSIPVVWAGVLCVGFLASKQYLNAFPVSGLHDNASDSFTFLPMRDAAGQLHPGYVIDTLWHICLPVLCLVYGGSAVLSKLTRASMLDNFNADYVRTAKAKGVASRDIVFRHVFRNSLLPIITVFAAVFPAMLSGSVVIERIFTIPGMGSLIIESINLRDRELLLANTVMISVVTMFALLLADILYALADPRISYE